MSDRKHLTTLEVDRLLAAAKGSRNEARDRCLLLLMFRHGLRVSEACGLRLSHVDTESRVLHVARLKKGLSTTHPLRADELRAIKAWLKEREQMQPEADAFFVSERRRAISRKTAWLAGQDLWRIGRVAFTRPSAHAAPCVRLCLGRPRGRHTADSGLSWAPEHSAYR
jgi:type 1 fimbriae regulatory protein FimB